MSVFVDTSALYAILDRDDNRHAEARATWESLLGAAERLVTSNYIVVEATALVQNRLGMKAVAILLDDLLPVIEIEWVSPGDHAAAVAALRMTGRRRVSLVDCTSFHVMRRLGISSAFAYDSHFHEQGFSPGGVI